jgi:hypothetical protein
MRAADRRRERRDRNPAHTQTRRTSQCRGDQSRPRVQHEHATPGRGDALIALAHPESRDELTIAVKPFTCSEENIMTLTVANQMVETLAAAGVERIYEIVGDSLNCRTASNSATPFSVLSRI